MNLTDLINRKPPQPWTGSEKIPWHEPDFSRRILESHLSQAHDWASRRSEIIDLHVDLIAGRLPKESRILDLGCGPGFYTQRLARQGFDCTGVDFSPASIEYARKRAIETGLIIEYVLEDIRTFESTRMFDAVLLTFGEFNVFKENDATAILRKASECLKDSGFLLLEIQTFEAVKKMDSLRRRGRRTQTVCFPTNPTFACKRRFGTKSRQRPRLGISWLMRRQRMSMNTARRRKHTAMTRFVKCYTMSVSSMLRRLTPLIGRPETTLKGNSRRSFVPDKSHDSTLRQ